MIKIDDKTRIRIFGMYINGTFVYSKGRYPYGKGDVFESSGNGDVIQCRGFLQVLVTPLHAITDEHAIEVAKMIYSNPAFHTAEYGSKWIRNKISSEDEYNCNHYHFNRMADIIDFLRCHGYATPCAGYSVEQLVEAGIFKIKTQ